MYFSYNNRENTIKINRIMINAVRIFRLSHYVYKKNKVLGDLIKLFNTMVNGCDIIPSATIGKNFNLPHPIGVVIGICTIGDNVTIFQNTTLGCKMDGTSDYPIIEDNVKIFCHSVILGNVIIKKDSFVKANSFIFNKQNEQVIK